MNVLSMADDGFRNTVVDTLEFGIKAYEIFVNSNNTEKRRLISFVLLTPSLKDGKLQFSLRKPFHLFVSATNCQEWRAREESNLRPAA